MGLYTQKLQGMDELCTAPAELQDIDQKNECQSENTSHYHHSILVFHLKASVSMLPRAAKRLEAMLIFASSCVSEYVLVATNHHNEMTK